MQHPPADGQDPEAHARGLEAANRPEEAARAWARVAGTRPVGPQRAEALAREARLLAELGRSEEATARWRRALANDPAHAGALAALAGSAVRERDWVRLAEIERLRFAAVADPDERAEIALEAARLERDQLESPGAAYHWVESGLRAAPNAAELLELRVELERDRGDATRLDALEQWLSLAGPEAPPERRLEAALLCGARGRLDAALAHLERALEQTPGDVRLLDALTPLLAEMDRPADLADALERRASLCAEAPESAGSLLVELGALREDRLFDFEGALEAYQRALTLRPDDAAALEAVARLGAKIEGGEPAAPLRAVPAPEPAPADPLERALRDLEREAHSTRDRTRLGRLVREIEALYVRRGEPARALPWLQRWAAVAPEDPAALKALALAHEREGNESEQIASLEALDALLPAAERAEARRRVAAIHTARGREEEAIRAWHGVLAVSPRDLDALVGLARIHRARGESDALLGVLERQVGLLEPRERASARAEVAALQRAQGDAAGELATLLDLEGEAEASAEATERIDELLEEAGRHEELAGRWERRSQRMDPQSALELELRRAALLCGPLARPDAAAAVYRAVLSQRPDCAEAASGLERSLRDGFDAEGLAELLAARAEESPDPSARERAALERATLLEEVLDGSDEAAEIYAALTDGVDPGVRSEAGLRLERLLERCEEWRRLRDHLVRGLEEGTPEQRMQRHERLARLCAERLHDAAAEREHLEAIVALDPTRGDVWRRLAARHEADGRGAECAAALERELEAGCDPERARTLHARLAHWYRTDLDDEARARSHDEAAFALDPRDTAAARHLCERYEADGRAEDLLRVLEARLAATSRQDASPSEDATALRVRIARVRADRLDDVEGAISALEVALGEVGAVPQVAETLAACYERAGYTLDLIELCRDAAARCREPEESANWWVRLGEALLSRDRPHEAADAYHRALTERPGDRAVQASLRAIHRRLERPVPLAELLEAELEQLAGPAEVPVRMELAALYGEPLERPDAALLHLQRVLQLTPDHPEAFRLALELARRTERPDAALALIEARLSRARDGAARADLHVQRARLLVNAPARFDEGVEAYHSALALAPSDALRDELAEHLENRGRWTQLLDLLSERARSAPARERDRWLERGAAIAAEYVGGDAALPWLERLRAERPEDAGVVRRIAEVHRASGRTEAQLRALSSCAALATSARERCDVELERAALLEVELDAPGRALRALEAAREALPGDVEVLEQLERLQRLLERHAERATTLESLIGLRPEAAADLHAQLARLKTGPLADPEGAIPHWESAIALTGSKADRIGHLRALAACHRAVDDLEGWARSAESELATLDPAPVFDDRRRTLRRELAFAYDGPLARPERALRHACALLDAGEDDLIVPDVLERMETLVLRRLREADAPAELENRLVRRLGRRPEDVALWLELGRLREERLHAGGAAIEAYRRALALAPRDLEALRGMRRAAQGLGRWTDVAETLERELDHPETREPKARAALLRRLGDVYWHRLQSTTRASRCYAAAIESDGADFAALRALERLLESMEDWRGALDLYESEVEVLGDDDPKRRREIWLHVAELARERTEETDRARHALERAAELAPLDAGELEVLTELHERAGDVEALVETLACWCALPEADAGAEAHLRLSTHLEALGRRDAALAAAEGALSFDPPTPDAWDAAGRLREELGDAEGAASALHCAAERAGGAEGASRLLHAASLVEPGQPRRALELLRDAGALDPSCVAVQAARARLAFALGRPTEAEAAASAALDLDTDASLEPASALEIAIIGCDAARSCDRLSEAAGFYARARELSPDDPRTNGRLGELLVALGELGAAREALERRLGRGDESPERAHHLTLLASCLEADGETEAALEAVDEALALSPESEEALAVSAQLRETLGRTDEAVTALELWARRAATPDEAAARLLRAAECELREAGREISAEAHLRAALRADPSAVRAWIALAELQLAAGRHDEVVECTDRAASHAVRDRDLSTLARLQGAALEQSGQRLEAAEAFGLAAEADPRCVHAALTRARLLRGAGEWRPAAEALQVFLARHHTPDDPALADVHEQLGRLLAGPLEDVNGATLAYRRAIALDPSRLTSRAALAELLSHRPGDREEAIDELRRLLDADPTDANCLRVALRIARANPAGAGPEIGIGVLRALGLATTYESDEPCAPPPPPAPVLRDRRFEQLRCIAQEAAFGIAKALEGSDTSADVKVEGAEAAFRSAMLRAEGQLTAPPLVPLETREVAEILTLVVRLAVDPDSVHGDGRRVNALTEALRRRERRRLRRWVGDTPAEELCEVDFEQWRAEVRALAAAIVVGEQRSDLRAVLVALLRSEDANLEARLRESPELVPLVARSPVARALVRRVVAEWIDRI